MTVEVKLDGLLDEAGALQPRTIALRRPSSTPSATSACGCAPASR
jgi:hypothetical protein